MTVKTFEMIVLPPDNPLEVPAAYLWQALELRLVSLPDDYRHFVNRYGTGSIDSFLWIFNPGSRNPNLNLERQVQKQLEALEAINQSGTESRIALFPAQGGMLPFGITDNGDVLAWATDGASATWTVSVLGARMHPQIRYELNMIDFLTAVCAGRIRCELFPEDFPSRRPTFQPKC